jgi:hypothetical protein
MMDTAWRHGREATAQAEPPDLRNPKSRSVSQA